jgi:2-dehydro-3-deoxygluconokinase
MPPAAPRVVAFGELLLRLKSPGHERLMQSPSFEATFGGAEANVAAALAADGVDAAFVTALPANAMGDAAVGELRRHGVDTRHVVRGGPRIGVYYLEAGAGARPSRVVYDREGSSIATTPPDAFDWDAALAGASWLHVSGITPALSASAAALTLAAVRAADARGVTVSCDYNYRANLWKWGKQPAEVMREIVRHVHVGVAGREDCQRVLGVVPRSAPPAGDPDDAWYRELAERTLEAFPTLRLQVITRREGASASRYGWSASLHDRARFVTSRKYEITDVVDRVGAGDAFTAGLIHALVTHGDPVRALEFATAASCLKHTIPGDVNRVPAAEVEALLAGEGGGRVQR